MVEKKMDQDIRMLKEQLSKIQKVNAELKGEISDLQVENEDLQMENEDLFEREALVRKIIEQAPDAFFVHDLDGRFVFVNSIYCWVLGYSKEELLEMSVLDVEYGLSPEQVKGYWDEVAAGKMVHTEGLFKRKDGSTFPVDIRLGLFDASGNKVVYGIARDISERKQFEERLRQAYKMEAVGTLAGGIAHDFNNILGIILGCAELAGDAISEQHPTREYLKEIKSAVLRAKGVIRQLLSFSQKSDQTPELMRIDPLIKESLKFMRATIPANIELNSMISDDCFMVMADPAQIHQVVVNLCTNAAHATRGGGAIEVSLENRNFDRDGIKTDAIDLEGKYLQLTIRDTGCGMPPELVERIFDPYFTTMEIGKGTGMGLAVVHGIIQSLGGVIEVESKLDRGTTFAIFFPGIENPERPTLVTYDDDESIPMGDEHVLVVDDEALIVSGLTERLSAFGYTVEGVVSPIEALERVRAQPETFDLLITDMAMPKMTGEMLISRVKEIREDLPVILCTGYSERIDAKSPGKIGAARIMLKPISREELAFSVRDVLDSF